MLKEKQLILAKVETTYGVDPVPTGAVNAILTEITNIEIVGRELPRNNVRPYYGLLAAVNVGDALRLSFTTEVKASGTAGTVPEIGVLFRACNFTETLTPATSVDYDPNSAALDSESVTLYFHLDGILFKLIGARGTWEFSAKAGEYGKLRWTFTGLFAKPTDTALATPTYSQVIPPRFLSAAFTIDGYAAVIENLAVNCGNEVLSRPSVNSATGVVSHFIGGRKVTGSIDPEAVLLATKDFYTMWENSSRVALTATLGQTAGNKCIITGPKVSLGQIGFADRNKLLTHSMPLNFTPNAGDDEIKFSFV